MSLMKVSVLGSGCIAMIFSFWKTRWIAKQDEGTDRMKSIGASISEGAMAFLKAEYRVLSVFILVVAILLGLVNYQSGNHLISLSFVVGSLASGFAGFLGMRVATKANNRTTHAARTGLASALKVAFTGGTVMGMSVVGLGVLGLGILIVLFEQIFQTIAVLSGSVTLRAKFIFCT